MHAYRTHTAASLQGRCRQNGALSGWVNRRRDHGGLIFLDLRDHYGITQCVIEPDASAFALVDTARSEWVLTRTGKVVARSAETVNKDLPTGEVETAHRAGQRAEQGSGTAAAVCSAITPIRKKPKADLTVSSTLRASG